MYVPGRNPVTELLRSKYPVKQLFLQEEINVDHKIAEITALARQRNVKPEFISRKQLSKISDSDDHQGVLALTDFDFGPVPESALEKGGGYIYIREAQYEQNAGAIIRTAEVAGLAGVILPPDLRISPTIVRISMGAIFHIPIYQHSLFPTIKQFNEFAFAVYGIERGGDNIFQAELNEDCLMIIGGEDHALSEEILTRCDKTLSIPQYGKVNSLNMSVAAGLVIYNYSRQHKQWQPS